MTPDAWSSRLFVDTSFFYATLDPGDSSHAEAKQIVEWVENAGVDLFSTWEIIVETVTLLRSRYSYLAAIGFIQRTLPAIRLFHITEADRQESLKLFQKFSSDKTISLCDVISYLVVTKYLQNIPCLAFDDDFRALGLTSFRPAASDGSA